MLSGKPKLRYVVDTSRTLNSIVLSRIVKLVITWAEGTERDGDPTCHGALSCLLRTSPVIKSDRRQNIRGLWLCGLNRMEAMLIIRIVDGMT